MANPQLEHGYTRIANELLVAMARFDFTSAQMSVLIAYLRMTYGFQRKIADLSRCDIEDITALNKRSIFRARKELKDMGVLVGDCIEKDYTKWHKVHRTERPISRETTTNESRNHDQSVAPLLVKEKRKKKLAEEGVQSVTHPITNQNTTLLVLGYFCGCYKKKIGTDYHVSYGKDHNLIKTMLKTFKPVEVRELIDAFFASTERFILNSGHTIGVFNSQINKLNSARAINDAPIKNYL